MEAIIHLLLPSNLLPALVLQMPNLHNVVTPLLASKKHFVNFFLKPETFRDIPALASAAAASPAKKLKKGVPQSVWLRGCELKICCCLLLFLLCLDTYKKHHGKIESALEPDPEVKKCMEILDAYVKWLDKYGGTADGTADEPGSSYCAIISRKFGFIFYWKFWVSAIMNSKLFGYESASKAGNDASSEVEADDDDEEELNDSKKPAAAVKDKDSSSYDDDDDDFNGGGGDGDNKQQQNERDDKSDAGTGYNKVVTTLGETFDLDSSETRVVAKFEKLFENHLKNVTETFTAKLDTHAVTMKSAIKKIVKEEATEIFEKRRTAETEEALSAGQILNGVNKKLQILSDMQSKLGVLEQEMKATKELLEKQLVEQEQPSVKDGALLSGDTDVDDIDNLPLP